MNLSRWSLLLVVAFTCCKSTPKPISEKAEKVAKREAANKALDEDIDIATAIAKRTYRTHLQLEKAPASTRAIDGDAADWKALPFRTFKKRDSIESGVSFWSGSQDLSTRIAFDTDGGWVYFFIQVKDDKVVVGTNEDNVADGVKVTILDPNLDKLKHTLPKGIGLDDFLVEPRSFIFLPDGRVIDDQGKPFSGAESGVYEHKKGYSLEVAFPLEAFGSVSSLPLREMAFRIDVLDGDDENAIETQTVLSTVPSAVGLRKRFSKIDVNLRPQAELKTGVSRKNAIGRWEFEGGGWSFVSFEVVPKTWEALSDLSVLEAALKKDKAISSQCNLATNDFHLVDAYQSPGGGFAAGLVICGTKVRKGKCSSKAKTRVHWIQAEKDDDGNWTSSDKIDVFSKPLAQCVNQSAKGPFLSGLSVYPLDILAKNIWMVGWTEGETSPSYTSEKSGVVLLNTDSERPIIGNLITDAQVSDEESRTLSNTSTYLALLNDDNSVDICQREAWEEQSCSDFLRGCEKYEKGLRHNIYMWNKSDKYFESYDLIKHDKCRHNYDLQQEKSYLILQLPGRIGLLSFSADEW